MQIFLPKNFAVCEIYCIFAPDFGKRINQKW